MNNTRIVAVVCNNDKEVGTSYTVVLEKDGTLVKVPQWSYVYAIGGTRRLSEIFERQLATTGVMSTDERLELFGNAEDLYDGA